MSLIFLFLLIALLVLIFCSAFFSASETALFSLPTMKIKTFKQHSDPRRQLISSLVSHPKELLITIIILNIVVNILIQNVTASLFSPTAGWLLKVGVPLGLTLILGEIIPKSIGLASNEKISIWVAPIMAFLQKMLWPVRRALEDITNALSRIFALFFRKEERISADELKHALATSRQFGVVGGDEAELVRGFLNLEEASVKQLMRPRDEILFFDIEDPLEKLIHLFVDQECSRVPICQGGFDHVLGVMTSRLFFLHRLSLKSCKDLHPFLQKPFFVPESLSAKSLLKQLYDKRVSLAMIVDEFGSVAGLITLEDLIEVVVGEIRDRKEIKTRYTRLSENVIIASGKLELDDFEQIFGIPLLSEHHMMTLGGWLTEQLGEIPKSGTKLETKQFLFQVLASDPNRVRRIYVRRLIA